MSCLGAFAYRDHDFFVCVLCVCMYGRPDGSAQATKDRAERQGQEQQERERQSQAERERMAPQKAVSQPPPQFSAGSLKDQASAGAMRAGGFGAAQATPQSASASTFSFSTVQAQQPAQQQAQPQAIGGGFTQTPAQPSFGGFQQQAPAQAAAHSQQAAQPSSAVAAAAHTPLNTPHVSTPANPPAGVPSSSSSSGSMQAAAAQSSQPASHFPTSAAPAMDGMQPAGHQVAKIEEEISSVVELSHAVPDGDDTPFADLVEYVILEVYNPQKEEEGNAASAYSIRIDRVRDIVDASPLVDWTNAQVRADKKSFDEHMASKLSEDEIKMFTDILFSEKGKAAGSSARTPSTRIFGRPKAHVNFKYGGMTVQFKNGEASVPQPLGSWEDMNKYQNERFRAFSDPGSQGADLVDINRIITAINRYVVRLFVYDCVCM